MMIVASRNWRKFQMIECRENYEFHFREGCDRPIMPVVHHVTNLNRR